MKPKQPDIAKWGDWGSRIKGSHMLRWYCADCKRPIRIRLVDRRVPHSCEVCSGERSELTPGGYDGPMDDVSGYQANAIRALEERNDDL